MALNLKNLLKFLLLLALVGCVPDAPRDNPLDPNSPDFKNSGILSGKVLSLYEPFLPVAGTLVTVLPQGISVSTNTAGSFSFDDVAAGNLTLIASKPGYAGDTLSLNIDAGEKLATEVHLDALPIVTSTQVTTRKVDQWWPGPVYSATVTANVSDPDGAGDIATVSVVVDTLRSDMTFFASPSKYQISISATALPGKNLEWLIGKPLAVIVQDKANETTMSKPFYITRIIQQTVIPTYPTALDTASKSPELQWAQPSVSFPFTYKLEMFRQDEGVPTQIWSREGLAPDLTRFQYPDVLPPALYFWTISIVDEYGNLSRSKEASFMVIDETQ